VDTVIRIKQLTDKILIKAIILDRHPRIITFLIMQDLKEISAKKRSTRTEILLDFVGNLSRTKGAHKPKITMGNLLLMELPQVEVFKETNPSIKETIIIEF
jgi:hypothetical protein